MKELTLLRELADAVAEMARYDDLGEPVTCEKCRPADPEPSDAARARVHQALAAYTRWAEKDFVKGAAARQETRE